MNMDIDSDIKDSTLIKTSLRPYVEATGLLTIDITFSEKENFNREFTELT